MPRSARLLIVCLVAILGQYALSVATSSAQSLTEEQQVVHVLNRLGFGPRLGDIEKVTAMGIEAYIEQQLYPERIPDPVVEAKLASFKTLNMSLEELLEDFGPAAPQGVRRRATVFEKRTMARRVSEGKVRAFENTRMPTTHEARTMMYEGRPQDYEIHSAKMIRAVYSERQLQELMTDFWMNHFNINFGDHPFTAHFEEQVIRPRAFGHFENLLMAVAKHPGMLNYLDNWLSSAPADVIQQRLAARKPTLTREESLALLERTPFLEQAQGLNENYARELMELHTLGVDGGYTQEDIIEVAKVLTGWTITGSGLVNGREDDGVFVFDPLLHVEGDKTVLGHTIPSGGIEEGEQVLKMLAHHPSTARFISTKLARRFVADDPPDAVVEAGARAFARTGGDIREVLGAIFTSPQFLSPEFYQVKIKKPLELVVSSMRAVNAEIDAYAANGLIGGNQNRVTQMGERVYNYEAPDGNPDVGSAWMNTNALLKRLEFANALTSELLFPPNNPQPGFGLTVDLPSARTLLEQLGMPVPTPEQIEQVREVIRKAMEEKAAAEQNPSMRQRQAMAAGGGASGLDVDELDTEALAVATMLGSPQFQKR
jgi:uncharacterized protein (DUF1800 family)